MGVFKPGALAAAQLTGLPIIPLAAGASSGWRFRSWDGFLVPKPLSSVRLEYLPPRFVPRDADRAELVRMSTEIGQDLNALTARTMQEIRHAVADAEAREQVPFGERGYRFPYRPSDNPADQNSRR